MCGIVGAVANDDVSDALLNGLARLEYRGYDSAGIATVDGNRMYVRRTTGKVSQLAALVRDHACPGHVGVAHSRWATHGGVSEANAHPQLSPTTHAPRVAVVHNGIVENYAELRDELRGIGYAFESDTDTEVIAHLVHFHLQAGDSLPAAVRAALARLKGAYAIVVIDRDAPDGLVAARVASPLVVGIGEHGSYVASDAQALLPWTRHLVFLEEGDVVELRLHQLRITDRSGRLVARDHEISAIDSAQVGRGTYRHYMLKEIHEQPNALSETLSERIADDRVVVPTFGANAETLLARVRNVHIVACGTSFHAGLIARYHMEQWARLPCMVDVASEYRYRRPVVPPGTLFVAISQSGETADTLAAMRAAKRLGYLATAVICNVRGSTLAREADLHFMTHAGPEIGVASTKAFTTQLVGLGLLGLAIAQVQKRIGLRLLRTGVRQLHRLPDMTRRALETEPEVMRWAESFSTRRHALFLGRGATYPVAMEGALKLKEVSYIHAEAYPAGELKHGPLALVDNDMPVVAVAPSDHLLAKLQSNLQEVRARQGKLYVLTDPRSNLRPEPGVEVLTLPEPVEPLQAPVLYTLPLQLLAYHVAVLRGTDVDQPRNLAKSVTVE